MLRVTVEMRCGHRLAGAAERARLTIIHDGDAFKRDRLLGSRIVQARHMLRQVLAERSTREATR